MMSFLSLVCLFWCHCHAQSFARERTSETIRLSRLTAQLRARDQPPKAFSRLLFALNPPVVSRRPLRFVGSRAVIGDVPISSTSHPLALDDGEASHLSEDAAELDEAMKNATRSRLKDHVKNAEILDDAQEAQIAVAYALDVLKKIYAKAGAGTEIMRKRAGEGMRAENEDGSVVGMFKVIESDFAGLEKRTKADEAIARKEYDDFMKKSKLEKLQKTTDSKRKSQKQDKRMMTSGAIVNDDDLNMATVDGAPILNRAPTVNGAPILNGAPTVNGATVNSAPFVNGAAVNGAAIVNSAPIVNGATDNISIAGLLEDVSGNSEKEHIEVAPIFEVSDVETAKDVVARLLKMPNKTFHACDTEVADLDIEKSPVGQGRVICLSIYSGPDADYGRGPGHSLWVDTSDLAVLEAFRPFLENEHSLKVWHNYGFDRHVIWNHNITVKGFGGDTMHMARLWDASRFAGYSLDALTDELVGRRKVPMKELFGVPKLKKDGTPGKVKEVPPVDQLQNDPKTRKKWVEYSAYDAQGTWLLHATLSEKLRAMDWQDGFSLYDFYTRYWRPFGELLTDMEHEGIHVDTKVALPDAQVKAEAERDRGELSFRRWAASFSPAAWFINPRSGKQIGTFLFGGKELPASQVFSMKKAEYEKLVSEWEQECLANAGNNQTIFTAAALEEALQDGFIEIKKTKVDITIASIGMHAIKKTKAGAPKTDAATLEALAGRPFDDPPVYGLAFKEFKNSEHGARACEAIAGLIKKNQVETLLNTFIIPLQANADSRSRVHSSLNLNTETGRLSSRSPNLQNQPALEKDLFKIRKTFCAEEGNSLVVADYGQLELRLLAHLASAQSMISAFKAGGCFHSRTAMGMFDHVRKSVVSGEVLLEWDYSKGQPTKPLLKDKFASERRKAKTLNFGLAYGKTVKGLAKDWGMPLDDAQKIYDAWYEDRPEVLAWKKKTIKEAHKTGSVRTLMNRYRPLVGINGAQKHVVLGLERCAINTPVQGGAADVVTLAMLKLSRSQILKDLGYKLLLQIHDEVILEGPTEHAEAAQKEVVACMTNPFDDALPGLDVELVVDAKTAKSWYEAK